MSKRIVLNCSKHRNGAYGIVMRGVQKCTCAGASLRGRKSAPLCCIKLDTATDPPYNTGNDFVYNDEFGMRNEEWNEVSGNYDEDGNQLVDNLVKNTENNGRFHTDWLNMIYPRLKIARDLLTDDGVIFISIDDNEQENMKKICDEIFGVRNFVAQLVWQRAFSPKNDAHTQSGTEN